MKNVKDQVYAALCTVFENVSDAYPRSWAEGSTIQYTEEQNDVYEASSDAEGMREDKALVRYRIDIWNNHSTSEAALQVDEAMKVTGLKRIACADVPDPSGMKHKQMRYEGIIDMDSDSVYWRDVSKWSNIRLQKTHSWRKLCSLHRSSRTERDPGSRSGTG